MAIGQLTWYGRAGVGRSAAEAGAARQHLPDALPFLSRQRMSCYFPSRPGVAELADAADSKSAGALLCVGSTPSSGTISAGHLLSLSQISGYFC